MGAAQIECKLSGELNSQFIYLFAFPSKLILILLEYLTGTFASQRKKKEA